MARKNKKAKKNNAVEPRKNRIIGNPVRVMIVMAVISILIGIALVRFYDQYESYFDFIIGGIVMAIGIVNIVFYFAKKMVDGVFRSEFALGIVCLAIGIFVALNGGASFSFLIVIGVLCALDGVIKLQYTLDLARMHYKKWWIVLAFAILGIVVGAIILMGILNDVFETSITYTGLIMCLNALFDAAVAILVAVRNRKALKAANAPAPVVVAVEEPEPVCELPEAAEAPAVEEEAEEFAAEPEAAEESAEEVSEAAEAVTDAVAEETSVEE